MAVFKAGQHLTADALNAAFGDTGVRGDLDITAALNWELLIVEYRIIGKELELRLQIQWNGASAIVGDAESATNPSNIANVTIATINDATKRPVMQRFPLLQASVTSGSGEISAATGEVIIADLHTSGRIRVGDTVELADTYTIP